MSDRISRRSMLRTGAAATALIPFPIWFEQYGAKASTPMVRYSAESTQGAANLATYRSVVSHMMSQPTGNPCSWAFQWYTHAVPSNTTKAAQIALLPAAQQPLATDMWNTCQAHGSTPGAVEDYFLPWHRMYVYFFERIVRTLSGNTNWTLPYWDYTVTAQRSIPTPFRSSSSNALYRPNRNSGGTAGNPNINAGQPLDYGLSPSPISQDFAAAVAETAYSPSGSHQGFNMTLDFGLHGDVHVLTGNGTNMGSVPFAAGDPVFYTHHCNIDRIWASWNNAGRANPTSSSWLNKTFIFADEHCNKVIGKIDDFKSIVPLNYTYDSFVRIPGGRVLNLGNLKFLAVQEGITIPNPPDPYHIAIPLNDEATSRLKLQTRSLVGSSSEVRLVLRNLTAKESPEVLYAVYVGLPAGSRTVPKGAKPVGYVNFFESAMPGMAMNEPQNRFHSFDVTEALRGAKMAGTERSLNVTLQPLGRPKAGAAPTIGRMELVATE